MPNPTLYLVQSTFAHTEAALNTLLQLYCPEDAVVFMGDAVLFQEDPRLKDIAQIYILEPDADILVTTPISKIKILNYFEFADLTLQFERSVRLK